MCELITEIAAASIKPAVTKSVRFAGVSDDGSKGSAGSGSPAKAGSSKGETLSLSCLYYNKYLSTLYSLLFVINKMACF